MYRPYKTSLEDLGFVVLPDLILGKQREHLSKAYDTAMSRGSAPDLRMSRDRSEVRLNNLLKYETAFDDLLVLGPVVEACRLVIGQRFKLSGLRARTVLPGGAEQAFHVDVAVHSDGWPLVGFIVMVDDFRGDNGATRFVPGSHMWAEDWRDVTTNHRPHHDQQVVASGTAGSVIVFNGSTWHGHGANVSNAARRSVQGHYLPRSGTSSTSWESLQPDVLARLPLATRQILGTE